MKTDDFMVSIVISNYNYESYVSAAIESALGARWHRKEVIVVDDGSTDGSRAAIARFGDRIVPIFQENKGQLKACIAGFVRSKGDFIMFLDADDLIHPEIFEEVVAVLRPGVSKVQFQMRTIDAQGASLGSFFPQYHVIPTPEKIREWALTAGAYPTPPGSGNLYAREVVEKTFNMYLPDVIFQDRYSDSPLLSAAPYLGDVVTIPKPLVSYRIHGRNDGAFTTIDEKRFSDAVRQAINRDSFSRIVASSVGITIPEHLLYRSLAFNRYRLASLRLMPALHPIKGDTRLAILIDTVRASMTPQGISLPEIVASIAWAWLVALSPLKLARTLILWRFAPTSRPRVLQSFLRRLLVVRG